MKQRWLAILFALLIMLIGLQSVQGGDNSVGGATAPSLWVKATPIDFGPVPVGHTAWWWFEFQNIGNANLSITSDATYNAPFSGTLPACATNLAPSASCTYVITFSPTATGSFNDTLYFETDAGPFSLDVHGEGINPHFYVDAHSLDFGALGTGGSRSLSIQIYNTGSYHLNLTTSSPPTPEFGSSSGDCSGGLPVNDSCTVYLSFQPANAGSFSDVYTINTSAGDLFIDLQGVGISFPILGNSQQVTPRSIDFGPVPLGDSKTITVTIKNQSLLQEITGWAGGGVASPFSATQNCANGVPAGGDCQFFYTFTPTAAGTFSTDSNVSNSAGSFSIHMEGQGVQSEPHIRRYILDFGPYASVSSYEAALANIGHTRLYINNVTVSDPSLFSPSSVCGNGLPPYSPATFCSINYDYSTATPAIVNETSTIATDGEDITITLIAGAQSASLVQAFVPNQIGPAETATLQYSISNPNPATTYYFVGFSNALPTGITYAEPVSYSASPECGSPTLTPIAGTPPTFMMSDGTVMGGETCVISVDVTAIDAGSYSNTLDFVETGTNPNDQNWIDMSNAASATLTVGEEKLFLPLLLGN